MKPDALAPIGVFDSGIGGLSVLKALRAELPHERFVYYADTAHAPYGERDQNDVIERSRTIAQWLVTTYRIKALVVACNTATSAAVRSLREDHPQLPLVGLEPGLRPAAAATRTGHVAVLATRGTLTGEKFRALHASLSGKVEFHTVACDGLARAIECGDAMKIVALASTYTRAAGTFGLRDGQIDTLVLGCTHYPFAAAALRAQTGPEVRFVDTGRAVALQTRRLLTAAHALAEAGHATAFADDDALLLTGSGNLSMLRAAARRWLDDAEHSLQPTAVVV